MRRWLSLICAVLILFSAGCGYAESKKVRSDDSYDLYYREVNLASAAGADALRVETVALSDAPQDNTEELATFLVERLLSNPVDPTLRSPVPAGTSLVSLTVDNGRAEVDLSPTYQLLSGIALTLADYAITLTLTQLPEISVVSITVRGQELAYRDRQSFTARDVLLSSTEDVVGTVAATLYFLNAEGALFPKKVTLDLYEGDTQVGAVVAALGLEPEEKELRSALPDTFRIKSVWLEQDVCYVNLLTAEMQNVPEQRSLLQAVHAVVRSLLSLESVSEVRFMVDGEFSRYYGSVPVAEPFHE